MGLECGQWHQTNTKSRCEGAEGHEGGSVAVAVDSGWAVDSGH